MRLSAALLSLVFSAMPSFSAITITGITDKTKYTASATFNVTADPNAATTTATLDGVPTTVGTNVTVTAFSYHELRAESRGAGGNLVDSRVVRFVVRNPERSDSEDGIPSHTPYKTVNDAPSAFVGGTLKVIAPSAWPVGLPIPIAAVLRDGLGEGLRLNGLVKFSGLPPAALQLRRGWGSVSAPPVDQAGVLQIGADVNGLTDNPQISFEGPSTVYTTISGAISSNVTWPPNSRIHVTDTLTINAGATLTIGAGTILLIDVGDETNGSAAEIVVNGTLQVNGADGNPVVFAPNTAGRHWGGIELPVATSRVNATHTIFTGSGEDGDWFDTHSGYDTHLDDQVLFLVAGSGSGTGVGAQLSLTNCYCFDLAGQQMNSRRNTQINLTRTLMQRAQTGGQQNGSRVVIDRSALIEMPSETEVFSNTDHDSIYLTNGEFQITNTIIGYTKDDGVDSGASGGDNPFTAASDVTPLVHQNNWFEGTYHEGNSLSGTRTVTYQGCVFFNCGQGIEAGYSSSTTGNGPDANVNGCLFVSNMVGVRWGDNYGSGFEYNASMAVRNSIVLNSLYRDAFSGNWHPDRANAWIYQTTATNTFGRQYFDLQNNYLSQPDPVHHPLNTTWNPAANGALLAPFMPVPNSNVGVAVHTWIRQDVPANYPGAFEVRLSTFSSKVVSVDYKLLGRISFDADESVLVSGSITFAPGETLKSVVAPLPGLSNFNSLRISLENPANAEVTGEAFYFNPPPGIEDIAYIPPNSSGWRYREADSEPPAGWKALAFDDSSPAATEWKAATLPAGYGVTGVTFGTTVNSGPSGARIRAFYFRKKFTVTDPEAFGEVVFRIRRDDAAVVWLNNNPTPLAVSADGTFSPPYTYAMTGTTGAVPNATEPPAEHTYTVPADLLVAGENILAIEVHQTSLTSGDALFDCTLVATPKPPLALFHAWSKGTPLLWWFDPAAVLERSTNLVDWFPAPVVGSPVAVPVVGAKEFFRLRR